MNQPSEIIDEVNEGHTAELVCNEPLLYKGLTTTELTSIAVVAFFAWAIGSFILIFSISGSLINAIMALPVGLIMSIVTVVVLAGVIQRLKRNKPDGHYEQLIVIYLKRNKLAKNHLIIEDQKWGL